MLELKVRNIGNLLGVVPPKEAIARLGTGEGERLFLVERPNGDSELAASDREFAKKMNKAKDIIRRYRNTLRALSRRRSQSGFPANTERIVKRG